MTEINMKECKCLFHITIPVMELRMSNTDKKCNNIVTRDLIIPYEGGLMTYFFCEEHYVKVLV